MNPTKILLLIAFAVTSCTLAQAQFNISVNYSLGVPSTPNYNNIIDTYNNRQDSLKIGFDRFGLLNGVGLGLRYRYRFAALEVSWLERFNRTEATGIKLEGTLSERRLGLRYSTYALTYTTFITDNWSFGGSINQDRFRMSTEPTAESIDGKWFVDEKMYSSRFFIGLNTGAGVPHGASLSIQPFVVIPWGEFDFSRLNNELNPGIPMENTKEDLFHFGISIIIYNGEQY